MNRRSEDGTANKLSLLHCRVGGWYLWKWDVRCEHVIVNGKRHYLEFLSEMKTVLFVQSKPRYHYTPFFVIAILTAATHLTNVHSILIIRIHTKMNIKPDLFSHILRTKTLSNAVRCILLSNN